MYRDPAGAATPPACNPRRLRRPRQRSRAASAGRGRPARRLEGVSLSRAELFDRDGFVAVHDLLAPGEVDAYRALYDRFLAGAIPVGSRRSDLGAAVDATRPGVENITQIMWPSDSAPELLGSSAYVRALAVARELLGTDMAFDFDMLIDKAPRTRTPTPWHQDAAYWIDLPDRRAASCWIALDEATVDNGCMWFVPGSHRRPMRPHRAAGRGGGALECDGSEDEGTPVPLRAGSCTFHAGGTMHYSRGNSSDGHRRALIVNFRPRAMVELERARGFDHGKDAPGRANRNPLTR
jgi:phytanoyl-CoA hydroxylase